MDFQNIPDRRRDLHRRIAARNQSRPGATTWWGADDWPIEALLSLNSATAVRIAMAAGDILAAARGAELLEVFLLWAEDVEGEGSDILAVARGVAGACVAGELEPEAALRIMCRDAVALSGRGEAHRAARSLVGVLQESACVAGYPDLGDGEEPFGRGAAFAVEMLGGIPSAVRDVVFDQMLRDLEPFFEGYEATVAARERDARRPSSTDN